jgi:hypothetical protein
MPTYRDVQYGISLLYGAVFRGEEARLRPNSWRLSADLVYLYHEPFTTVRGELTFGADGRTSVRGLLVELTQILPSRPHWGIEAQARAWRGRGTPGSPAAGTGVRAESALGIWHSLPALLTLRLHWLHYFPHGTSAGDEGIFAQLYYYGP